MAPTASTSHSPVNAMIGVGLPLPILTNIKRHEQNHSTRLAICYAYFDDGNAEFPPLSVRQARRHGVDDQGQENEAEAEEEIAK